MNVIVIGGGAAGMMACIAASNNKNNKVILIEKNEKLGKKIFITGKGRCNVTNNCDFLDFFENIVRNKKFLYSSFNLFNNKDLINLLETNGLKLKVERGNRVFPLSDKAYDVTDTLKKILNNNNVRIILRNRLINININNDKNNIKSIDLIDYNNIKHCIECDKLIIATGGLSYPSTGSTGDGYKFAKKFGIEVTDLEPSLVPIDLKEKNECYNLEGLSLKNVKINIYENDKLLFTDFGEMIFTDTGVSGPIILSASSYISNEQIKHNLIFSIDLKPAVNFDELNLRLLNEFSNNKLKNIKSIFVNLLPRKLIDVFIGRLNNELLSKNCSNISKDERYIICKLLKDFRFTIDKKRDFNEAIITKGGININELNPKNMESKKIKGLHFAGEVIDIDCLTGGFNLQVAFTTGYAAGLSIL